MPSMLDGSRRVSSAMPCTMWRVELSPLGWDEGRWRRQTRWHRRVVPLIESANFAEPPWRSKYWMAMLKVPGSPL